MAASTGEAWSQKLTISAKFKLSNVISDQLMDCYVSIVMHYDIAGLPPVGELKKVGKSRIFWQKVGKSRRIFHKSRIIFSLF